MNHLTIHEVREKLQDVRGGNAQFTARCPAHDDRHNSLSVGMGDNGGVVLFCHAGCASEAVVGALGLSLKDLAPNTSDRNQQPQSATPEAEYVYTDEHGVIVHKVIRYGKQHSTAFSQARPDPDIPGGWIFNLKGITPVLYHLPEVSKAIREGAPVIICEGEKDCDTLARLGYTATTNAMGAGKWRKQYNAYLRGATVFVIGDNDEPGRKHVESICRSLVGVAKTVKVVDLIASDRELPEHGDITDFLARNTTNATEARAVVAALMETACSYEKQMIPSPSKGTSGQKGPRITQAETLLRIVDGTGADFFRSSMGDLYASIPIEGHREVWALDGREFAEWLHGRFYRETGQPVNNDAVGQAISVLSARARFDRPEPVTLSTRVAAREGSIWVDLSSPAWQAVEITPEGWSVRDNPPILFTRFRHQAAQVAPQPCGDVRRILNHVNLRGQETLFLCWLISCFVPDIPHAAPIFFGEKGAAKSTTCGLLKALIDPSALETLTLQSDPRALAVNLTQHWFLPFDNVSYLGDEVSDTLCRAITGGGIQQRKLYTNSDDAIFSFKRCLAINGINNVATRPDLLDRSLLIELERIRDVDRRELSDIRAAFESDRPVILGGIFDALARAMAIYPIVKLDRLPRMADFARWGYAIGEALGGLGQRFVDEYAANQKRQNIEALESDPVATLIICLMESHTRWDDTATKLFEVLSRIAPDHGINPRGKSFPADPARLSRRLNALRSNLETAGITFEKRRTMYGAIISLAKVNVASLPSYRHEPSDLGALRYDGAMTLYDAHPGADIASVMPKSPICRVYDATDANVGATG